MKAPPISIPPAAAQQLLERVLLDAVADCIDVDALTHLESTLMMEIADIGGVALSQASAIARTMIDRAWREASELARLQQGPAADHDAECDVCADAARGPAS